MKYHRCPCRECRPKGESLRQAFRRINRAALIERHGVEGAARIEAAKRERLRQLHLTRQR